MTFFDARAVRGACLAVAFFASPTVDAASTAETVEYRVLATNKTSTMEKEMRDAAAAGFRFGGTMGGETSFGGNEVVVVMTRVGTAAPRYEYRLLATTKTSTMQRELQEAAAGGFEYRGQSVFSSMFGGKEVVVILERDRDASSKDRWEYRLLATSKTSTMQRELSDTGAQGFEYVGMTVASTAMGGNELVTITRRKVQ
ncbi:MAG: hypothetical protein ABIT71_03815 [Vicinamibacteraceae bacterium]